MHSGSSAPKYYFGAAASAAALAARSVARAQTVAANDRIRIGCIGLNGRGNTHIAEFSKQPGSEVVALCDVDQKVLDQRLAEAEQRTGKRPKAYRDLRELIADPEIDAISIATPNHWHTLAAVWACQAGKDVYVEKPLSHDVWEGRQLVAAAQKYGRIVQHGTHTRSNAEWMRAARLLREGIIGDIYMVRTICFNPRQSIGMGEPAKAPEWLDWNLWQGPAQERELCNLYVHYNWHWFWEYGNGEIGNNGVHHIDIALWITGKGLPVKIDSMGGRFTYKDQAETPNTQVSTFTYDDGTTLVDEVRGRFTNTEGDIKMGVLCYGTNGYSVETNFYDKDGKEMPVTAELPPTEGPFGNFLKAVRSRKEEDIHGTVMNGHLAAAHCHLANISYRIGKSFEFDPATETAKIPEATALLKRTYREPFSVPQLA